MKRILIVKLCCIGDLLQMTPMINAVRRKYPDAQIDFLAATWVHETLRRIPAISQVIPWNELYGATSWMDKVRSLWRVVGIIRKRNYDAAIIGHRSSAFSFLAKLAGIPTIVGFSPSSFLTHSAPFDPNMHEAKRYLQLASSLDPSPLGRGQGEGLPSIIPLPEDISAADALLTELLNLNSELSPKIVSIFPGGGNNPGTAMPIKQWPREKWAECIAQLSHGDPHTAFLLLGDRYDAPITAWIKKQLPEAVRAYDLGGKTSFSLMTGLLYRSDFVMGGDSGPLHMAAALGRQTVMLFGPSDPRLVAPLNARVLWKQVPCAPCYTPMAVLDKSRFKNGEFPCHTGTHECMKTLSVEEVLQATNA